MCREMRDFPIITQQVGQRARLHMQVLLWLSYLFSVALGFELRAPYLLDKCSHHLSHTPSSTQVLLMGIKDCLFPSCVPFQDCFEGQMQWQIKVLSLALVPRGTK
jgi:hypothetical protein